MTKIAKLASNFAAEKQVKISSVEVAEFTDKIIISSGNHLKIVKKAWNAGGFPALKEIFEDPQKQRTRHSREIALGDITQPIYNEIFEIVRSKTNDKSLANGRGAWFSNSRTGNMCGIFADTMISQHKKLTPKLLVKIFRQCTPKLMKSLKEMNIDEETCGQIQSSLNDVMVKYCDKISVIIDRFEKEGGSGGRMHEIHDNYNMD